MSKFTTWLISKQSCIWRGYLLAISGNLGLASLVILPYFIPTYVDNLRSSGLNSTLVLLLLVVLVFYGQSLINHGRNLNG